MKITTTPEEIEELTGRFAKEDADVSDKVRKVKEGEAKAEIYVRLDWDEPLNDEFDVYPYCGKPLLIQYFRTPLPIVIYKDYNPSTTW